MGIQFLYAVPYFLLVLILYLTIFGDLFALYANGYRGNALSMAMERNLEFGMAGDIRHAGRHRPLMYGMMRFYIGLFRGGGMSGVSALFQPFTSLHSFWAGSADGILPVFPAVHSGPVLPTALFFFVGMGLLVNAVASGALPDANGFDRGGGGGALPLPAQSSHASGDDLSGGLGPDQQA